MESNEETEQIYCETVAYCLDNKRMRYEQQIKYTYITGKYSHLNKVFTYYLYLIVPILSKGNQF